MTENVLEEALRICDGDRQDSYGHPFENFSIIQKFWSATLGIEVTYDQIVFCMIGVKMARHLSRGKRDNIVDIAGYAWVLDKVKERAGEGL